MITPVDKHARQPRGRPFRVGDDANIARLLDQFQQLLLRAARRREGSGTSLHLKGAV